LVPFDPRYEKEENNRQGGGVGTTRPPRTRPSVAKKCLRLVAKKKKGVASESGHVRIVSKRGEEHKDELKGEEKPFDLRGCKSGRFPLNGPTKADSRRGVLRIKEETDFEEEENVQSLNYRKPALAHSH